MQQSSVRLCYTRAIESHALCFVGIIMITEHFSVPRQVVMDLCVRMKSRVLQYKVSRVAGQECEEY